MGRARPLAIAAVPPPPGNNTAAVGAAAAGVPAPAGDGLPALWAAARRGDLAAVQRRLEAAPALRQATDPDGWNLLLHAASAGQHSVIRWLLATGTPLDAPLASGRTPLQLAAWAGDETAVASLVSHGATLEAMTALLLGAEELLGRLLDANPAAVAQPDGRGETLLHVAVEADRVEEAALLLARGAPLDALDAAGQTPLHRLLARHPEPLAGPLAELLVAHGAWVDPVMAAALDLPGCLPLAPHPAGGDGRTLLHWAAATGSCRALRELLRTGLADPHQPDADGQTALDLALRYGHPTAAELLRGVAGAEAV